MEIEAFTCLISLTTWANSVNYCMREKEKEGQRKLELGKYPEKMTDTEGDRKCSKSCESCNF